MKQKLSVTLEEGLIRKIEEKTSEGIFRNKSHVVEYAVMRLMQNE